eukprot:9178086-Pyramimonas_sp.AAC.1
MALAPLRALTGPSILRERSGSPCILPCGELALSMRLSHASCASSPAGVDAAGAPASVAARSFRCRAFRGRGPRLGPPCQRPR